MPTISVKSWHHTRFAKAYATAKIYNGSEELTTGIRKLTQFYAATRLAGCGADMAAINAFVTALGAEQLESKRGTREYLHEVDAVAQRFWSSSRVLTMQDGKKVEFCSILNCLLREDREEKIKQLTRVCRSINERSVTRGEVVEFPEDRRLFRGGSLPDHHRSFFVPGKKYRAPAYVATTKIQQVTQGFLQKVHKDGLPPVLWIIHVDHRDGCSHVNYVERSNMESEKEYLFVAYSVFTVRSVVWKARPTWKEPHCIEVDAASCNLIETEEEERGIPIPLAPWT